MNITAAQVNELRQMTGAGMMDCKKALVECNGDKQLSTTSARKARKSLKNALTVRPLKVLSSQQQQLTTHTVLSSCLTARQTS